MRRFISLLIQDDTGQDLIEYALLTTFVSLAVIAVFDVITAAISATYTSWNSGTNSIWETPNPSGS
jgi:Flp pilus assembly pilin Flp